MHIKICLIGVKIGFLIYVCVFVVWLAHRDYWRSDTRLSSDVKEESKVRVNKKGHQSVAQTSELIGQKAEINTSKLGVRTLDLSNFYSMPDSEPYMLSIVVCSHPAHVQRRLTIRRTWGYNLSKEVMVVFLIGIDRNEAWKSVIERENMIHHDVVQINVIENYRNLTRKMIAGLNYIITNFSSVKYVLKTDDDAFLNLPYILQEVKQHSQTFDSHIVGALCINATVIRDSRDVWSVSRDIFPYSKFPPYVAGGAYVISRKTLSKLLSQVTTGFSFIHLEDVYITGILAQSAGIQHKGHPGFSFWNSKRVTACDMLNNRKISSVNLSDEKIKSLYDQIQIHAIKGCLDTS